MTTKTADMKAEREDARRRLLAMLEPGACVYVVPLHASKSGMSRRLSLLIALAGSAWRAPDIQSIDWLGLA